MTAPHRNQVAPTSSVRPRLIPRTEHDAAICAVSRAMTASGTRNTEWARACGVDEALVRRWSSGTVPLPWPRVYMAPLPLRLSLAAELRHGVVVAGEDVASGHRLLVARVGLSASALELAVSPLSEGGVAITANEAPAILRSLDAIEQATATIRAAVTSMLGSTR